MIIGETERLLLRRFEQEDAPVFYHMNANPKVLEFTGDIPFESIESTEDFIANYSHYHKHEFGRWSVVLKSTNECIGWSGLRHKEGIVDVGFRFLEKHWGNGYATESANTALRIGFEDFQLANIVGRCSIHHTASANVLKKIGMKWQKQEYDQGIGAIDVYLKENKQ